MKHSNSHRLSHCKPRGMTLIEISIVLALILTLVGMTWMSFKPIKDWQKAKEAGISLQAVYTAQKTFLADHPTCPTVPNITLNGVKITAAQLQPYLPGSTTGTLAPMPSAVDLAGNTLDIDFTVIPPVLKNFSDPSGSLTDGLWDIGKP